MDIRVLTIAACLVAGPAFASCSQSDITGSWNAYSVGASISVHRGGCCGVTDVDVEGTK
jgi:hypothetical protein